MGKSAEFYHLRPGGEGCVILCIPATAWPAISGMWSDRLWEFDEDMQPIIMELLEVSTMDCCQTLIDCGIATVSDLADLADLLLGTDVLVTRHPALPPERLPEEWPITPPVDFNTACRVASALWDAHMNLYGTVYQGEGLENASEFVGVVGSLLIDTLADILALFTTILGTGAYALLLIAAAANETRVICQAVWSLQNGHGYEAVRDQMTAEFALWTPFPLTLIKEMILPLAQRMFPALEDVECLCAKWNCTLLLGTFDGDGCYQWIDSEWNEYHNSHCISICYGDVRNINIEHQGHTNHPTFSDWWYSDIEDLDCPMEWVAEFEEYLNNSAEDLPASPFDVSTSYFLILSTTPFRIDVDW